MKKWLKDIRVMMISEILLLAAAFTLALGACQKEYIAVNSFIDIPSILGIVVITVPGLIIMGEWKNFTKAFTAGIKKYSLLELKNICGAVAACQKLVAYSAAFDVLISVVIIISNISNFATVKMIGPNLATAILSCFYAIILEIILLPLRTNSERKMNEEIDMEYEDTEG